MKLKSNSDCGEFHKTIHTVIGVGITTKTSLHEVKSLDVRPNMQFLDIPVEQVFPKIIKKKKNQSNVSISIRLEMRKTLNQRAR